MMKYGNSWSMMQGAGAIGVITWLLVLIDLVLLGIWLWKQINKKQ